MRKHSANLVCSVSIANDVVFTVHQTGEREKNCSKHVCWAYVCEIYTRTYYYFYKSKAPLPHNNNKNNNVDRRRAKKHIFQKGFE